MLSRLAGAAQRRSLSNVPLLQRALVRPCPRLAADRHFSFSFPGPRSLKDIAKLPLLKMETAERIREIWEEHHRDSRTAIGTTVSDGDLAMLLQRGRRCPMALVPVHREGGFFLLLSQCQDSNFLLTFLEDYKRDPGTAQPYLVISTFQDLAAKGVGLMRGDISPNLTKKEAETTLSLLVNHLYLGDGYDALEQFNLRPQQFDFDSYIQRCPKPVESEA